MPWLAARRHRPLQPTPVFTHHGWLSSIAAQRITGQDAEAIWTSAAALWPIDARAAPLWNRLGRKVDPTGIRTRRKAGGRPILGQGVMSIIRQVAARINQRPRVGGVGEGQREQAG